MEKVLLKRGDEVGNYVLLEELASGGTARVFSARHRVFGYSRALKIMHLHESIREDAMSRWQREAVLLSNIQHGNIVRVHDAGLLSSHGLFWIAMDLLHGQTLRELLRATPRIPIAPSLYYGSQIADGVHAAHEMRVVHRDVKPENVFITEANEVKVLDLGTAKVQGYGVKTTDQYKVRGTLLYMAPEQCEGRLVDARTDIYALGLVLYEMMAGKHPFIHPNDPIPTPQELVTRHLVVDPEPLPMVVPGFPDYIWRVVERAVRKDPNERYGSMLDLSIALRDVRQRALNAAMRHGHHGAAVAHAQGAPRVRQGTAPWLSESAPPPAPVLSAPALSPQTELPGAVGPRGTFRMVTAQRDGLEAALQAATPVTGGLRQAHGTPGDTHRSTTERPSDAPPLHGAVHQAAQAQGTAQGTARSAARRPRGPTLDTPPPVTSLSGPPAPSGASPGFALRGWHGAVLGVTLALSVLGVWLVVRGVLGTGAASVSNPDVLGAGAASVSNPDVLPASATTQASPTGVKADVGAAVQAAEPPGAASAQLTHEDDLTDEEIDRMVEAFLRDGGAALSASEPPSAEPPAEPTPR